MNQSSETQSNFFVWFFGTLDVRYLICVLKTKIYLLLFSRFIFLSLFFFEFIYSQSLHCFIFCTICYLYVCMRILLFSVCFYSCSNTRYSLRSIFLLFTCYVCILMCVWMCIYGFRESVCCFLFILSNGVLW